MRRDKVFDVLEEIDDKYIDEAVKSKETGLTKGSVDGQNKRKSTASVRMKWIAVAAGIALTILAGSTAVAINAEATEYKEAKSFFEDNDISVEGLSRAEIKAVYRDIVSNRFENEKTAELIKKNIPGYEISPEEPAAEELAEAWKNRTWVEGKKDSEYTYETDYVMGEDEERGTGQTLKKTVVTCLKSGEKMWAVDIERMWVVQGKIMHSSLGTLLWESFRVPGPDYIRYYDKMVCVGDDGTIKWEKIFDHGSAEHIYNVLEREDGTVAVFSTHYEKEVPEGRAPADTQEYLCVCILDGEGNENSVVSSTVGKGGRVGSVTVSENGYLVTITNIEGGKTAVFRTDRVGKVLGEYGYEADDRTYDIVDQIEYEGKLYISAFSYPKKSGDSGPATRFDMFDAMNEYVYSFIADKSLEELYGFLESEEYLAGLLEVARRTFSAVLLICEDGGEPTAFYSIKGSMGSKLKINEEGQLEWLTIDLRNARMSVVYNSWYGRVSGAVYRNVFDTDGKLIKQEDTGENDGYER
ncbi:MAG: hypothetical protein J6113_05050 [Lachnospiraceae bacterium]|nr:hypothetical protein [Lachnospiraceae bacterium]